MVTLSVLGVGVASCVVATPVATAASNQPSNQTVVNAWYDDFLGRDAQVDPGSKVWVAALDRGEAPDAVVTAVLGSREHVTRAITGYYVDLLGRSPDPGATYWIDGVVRGDFPLEWVEQNVYASEEYAARHADGRAPGEASRPPRPDGPTASLVRWWYDALLNRSDQSDGEIDYWSRRIAAVGRLGALREMWCSSQAVRCRVVENYYELLPRGPDGPGADYWAPREAVSKIAVVIAFAASQEYRTLSDAVLG